MEGNQGVVGHLGAAEAARRAGDLAAELAAMQAVTLAIPDHGGHHHRLGVLREREGDWLGAVSSFASAADRDPNWAARHFRLGMARELMWDFTGAAEAYATAAEMAPERSGWAREVARARAAAIRYEPFRGLVVAHRGRAGGAAENHPQGLATLPALVAGVEVDVRLSRDGTPVLMHDPTVDRTTDGTGEVAQLSYPHLRQLTCQGAGGVPALPDYLEACKGPGFAHVLLDLKAVTDDAFRVIADVTARSSIRDRCVLLVRDEQQLRRLREVGGGRLRLGLLGTRTSNVQQRIEAAQTYGAEMVFVAHGDRRYLANRAVVAELRRAGLAPGGSIINSRQALDATRQDRCEVILTDRSDQLSHFAGAV